MGNHCCVSRNQALSGINFDKKEKKQLKEMFSSLVNSQPEYDLSLRKF